MEKEDWVKNYERRGLQGKEKYDVYIGKAKGFEERA